MLPLHARDLGDLPSSSQSLLIDRALLAFHTLARGLGSTWPCLHLALFSCGLVFTSDDCCCL